MKKLLHITSGIAAIVLMFNLQSCDKLKSAVKTPDVNFTGASADITIPPTSDTTEQIALGETSFSYNLDSMIKAQTGGAVGFSSIKSIKVTSIMLTLTDGTSANNFANFIYAGGAFNTDANGGNYDQYTLAYIDNNPDVFNTELTPPVVDASQDIKKYFNPTTTFYYLVVGKLRRPVTTTLHCHVDVTYDIGF